MSALVSVNPSLCAAAIARSFEQLVVLERELVVKLAGEDRQGKLRRSGPRIAPLEARRAVVGEVEAQR